MLNRFTRSGRELFLPECFYDLFPEEGFLDGEFWYVNNSLNLLSPLFFLFFSYPFFSSFSSFLLRIEHRSRFISKIINYTSGLAEDVLLKLNKY